MTARLAGKVALITGAASGIGAATARAFVQEGARVVIGDLDDAGGSVLASALGDAAAFIHLDVTDADQWAAAVQAAVSTFGTLDILVNNAGVFITGAIEDYPRHAWDQTLAVNLTGAFLGVQACLPTLTTSSPASVINISSTAGIEGYAGCAGYSASKWGLRGLTRSAALELADIGIRVNTVHPGAVATPLLAEAQGDHDAIPDGASTLVRPGRPEEVANLLVFLASDEASFCTGGEYTVDGGITAGPHLAV